MVTAGKSLAYIGHQRLTVRPPLLRLHHEVDTLVIKVDEMEKCRSEYRAALSWVKSVSQQLDPDTGHGVDKFRKAQGYVRLTKNEFDKYTLACLQKVDLLAAARCNMFRHALIPYINALSTFATKATEILSTAGEHLDKVEPYDFDITAELAIPNEDKDKETFFNAEYSDKNEDPKKGGKENSEGSKTQDEVNDVMNLLGDDFSSQETSTNNISENLTTINSNPSLLDLTEDENNSDLLSKDFFMPSNLMQGGFNFTNDDLEKLEKTVTDKDLQKKSDTAKQDAQMSWLSLFEELDPLSNKNLSNRNGDQL